ncbi:MAG: glycosyltransferase family 39 protein [Ignavibacteria bacterium]|nr:glycosyltransferase family 39 protein [Ignavibacteria bacterium]
MTENTLRSLFLGRWHPYAWIALASCLLYGHILTFSDYTFYDDDVLIARHFSHIDELSDIGREFFEDAFHQAQGGNFFRPLLTISFILSAQVSGLDLWGYHLTDIVLHLIASMLVFVALKTLGIRHGPAFVCSLLFCLHPSLTQAVAWVSGRNDTLLTVFILPCFIFFVKFLEAPSVKWYLLHMLFFALSMLTKETAIVFPVLALFYAGVVKKQNLLSLSTVLWLVGWGLVLLNWRISRDIAQLAPVGDKWFALKTVFSDLPVLLSYLGKIFWPFDLAFAPFQADINFIPGIAAALLLIAAIVLAETRNWRIITFGLLWYVLFLVPTLFHHADISHPPKFYEHRIYLSFIGIMMIPLSLSFARRYAPSRVVSYASVTLAMVVLGVLSFNHSFDFKNHLTLREFAARTSPSDDTQYPRVQMMHVPEDLARQFLARRAGTSSYDSARTFQASSFSTQEVRSLLEEAEQARWSRPDDPTLHHRLAVINFARGYYVRSMEEFQKATAEEAENADLQFNLGVLCYDGHAVRKAEQAWLKALQLNSRMAEAHQNLSYLFYEQKQYENAWSHAQEATRLGAPVIPGLATEIQKFLGSSQRQQ